MSSNPVRVFLWTAPRSVSTAFTRSMENIPNVNIFLEPYGTADHFGPEGRIIPENEKPTEEEYTFDRVKEMLEDESMDENVVFVKDMAYAVDKMYDKIATGYKHTFLIRHPAKSFLSHYKLMLNTGCEDLDKLFKSWLPEGLGYKELSDLVDFIEATEGSTPFILNADDLLENPKGILTKYCEAVGLQYSDELLSWECKPKVEWKMAQSMWDFDSLYKWFSNSLKAGGFKKSFLIPPPDLSDLPKVVAECVEASMQYYEKLNSRCIRP